MEGESSEPVQLVPMTDHDGVQALWSSFLCDPTELQHKGGCHHGSDEEGVVEVVAESKQGV